MNNFIFSLSKSDSYALNGVEESYKILNHCITQINEGNEQKIFRQIASVELRKLLCDQPESILKLDKKIKLVALSKKDDYKCLDNLDKLYKINITPEEKKLDKMGLNKWLSQKLYYYDDRTSSNMPNYITQFEYDEICKHRLVETSLKEFKSLFEEQSSEEGIRHILIEDNQNRDKCFQFLEKCGYNYIDVRTAIKLVANKAGAHSASEDPIGLLYLNLNKKYIIFDWIIMRVFIAMKTYYQSNM